MRIGNKEKRKAKIKTNQLSIRKERGQRHGRDNRKEAERLQGLSGMEGDRQQRAP